MARLRKLPQNAKRLPDGRIRLRVTRSEMGQRTERSVTLPEDATRQEVAAGLAELQRRLVESTQRQRTPTAQTTLLSYAQHWLVQRVQRGELSPYTAEVRAQIIGHHITPVLGHYALEDLSREAVQSWVDGLALRRKPNGERYARPTVEGWWRVARVLIGDAMIDHGLPDPTRRMRLGRHVADSTPRRQTDTPTREEVAELLEYLSEHEPHWHRPVFALFYTGLRFGELCELRGGDIDEAAQMIRVRRSFKRVVKTPKTRAGMRDLPLTDAFAAVVLDEVYGPDDLVFSMPDGARLQNNGINRAMQRAAESCGWSLRPSCQTARRYVNTALVEAGVDGTILRSMLGHVGEVMTANYAGAMPDSKRAALAALGNNNGGE